MPSTISAIWAMASTPFVAQRCAGTFRPHGEGCGWSATGGSATTGPPRRSWRRSAALRPRRDHDPVADREHGPEPAVGPDGLVVEPARHREVLGGPAGL